MKIYSSITLFFQWQLIETRKAIQAEMDRGIVFGTNEELVPPLEEPKDEDTLEVCLKRASVLNNIIESRKKEERKKVSPLPGCLK